MPVPIKIIDLFAGPGGLGEGFSSYKVNDETAFRIAVSIEKEPFEHQTLLLRSFYRQFKDAPQEYYDYLQGKIERETLFNLYPEQFANANGEAWQAELGGKNFPHKVITSRIKQQLGNTKDCILIGGPPCQAYSLAGRSKMSKNENFEKDPRHTLYKEYLNIIAEFKPKVFVMENVKGILSSKLEGKLIFEKIIDDLKNPQKATKPKRVKFYKTDTYTIYSLVTGNEADASSSRDFIIKCEDYGIPQARHRVILLGIRNDINAKPDALKKNNETVNVGDVISDLPNLRSGLSKQEDSYENWKYEILKFDTNYNVYKNLNRGSNFITSNKVKPKAHFDWYFDKKLGGVLNHETRAHINADLHRYYFYAEYAKKHLLSPKLEHLPEGLLPNHKNVKEAIKGGSLFSDRFRVQLRNKPATTITSHISKDGHYFIHYDQKQCRSLTVREAARIQTFPDNYKFEGLRTVQYHQVGNAVPPLLAKQIAQIVYDLINE
jgi:DNA (cytosine-5)-methyltransferase 1